MKVINRTSYCFEEKETVYYKGVIRKNHLTMADVASSMGIMQTRLSNILHGRCWISKEVFLEFKSAINKNKGAKIWTIKN